MLLHGCGTPAPTPRPDEPLTVERPRPERDVPLRRQLDALAPVDAAHRLIDELQQAEAAADPIALEQALSLRERIDANRLYTNLRRRLELVARIADIRLLLLRGADAAAWTRWIEWTAPPADSPATPPPMPPDPLAQPLPALPATADDRDDRRLRVLYADLLATRNRTGAAVDTWVETLNRSALPLSPAETDRMLAAIERMTDAEVSLLAADRSGDDTAAAVVALRRLLGREFLGPEDVIAGLTAWRAEWEIVPGMAALAESVLSRARLARTPDRLALLLPLTDRYAPYGRAVLEGFLAAYYRDRQADARNAPLVTIIDTAVGDSAAWQRELQASGSRLAIGPLLREDVERMIAGFGAPDAFEQVNHTTQWLLLNVPEHDIGPVALPAETRMFDLRPELEGHLLAAQLERDRRERLLLVSDRSEVSTRIRDAFEQDWQTRAGEIAGHAEWAEPGETAAAVSRLLLIEDSEARATRLDRLIDEPFEFVPRRREDFDGVVLFTDFEGARATVPALRYYFVGAEPIYAPSQAAPPSSDPARGAGQSDLDGLRLLVPGWLIGTDPLSEVLTGFPPPLQRFAALGADAFRTARRWPPGNGRVPGSSGRLEIDGHVITPRPVWSLIAGGELKPLPVVVDRSR